MSCFVSTSVNFHWTTKNPAVYLYTECPVFTHERARIERDTVLEKWRKKANEISRMKVSRLMRTHRLIYPSLFAFRFSMMNENSISSTTNDTPTLFQNTRYNNGIDNAKFLRQRTINTQRGTNALSCLIEAFNMQTVNCNIILLDAHALPTHSLLLSNE